MIYRIVAAILSQTYITSKSASVPTEHFFRLSVDGGPFINFDERGARLLKEHVETFLTKIGGATPST